MSIALEAYTAEGLLTGAVVADGRLVDLLFSTSSITLDEAVVTPFAGARNVRTGAVAWMWTTSW